jgi:hypothetical protein
MYLGEYGEDEALVQGDTGHRGEWAAPRAGDRCNRRGYGGGPCGQ